MRIEGTPQEIRALLQLAAFDLEAAELPLETYRSRRDAIRRRTASALLERYQALVEAGRHPAIVVVERGACSGCHLRLPTMVESRFRRSPGVYACPHCRRMLYAPELLTAQEPRGLESQETKASHRASRASTPERS
jgi:predicted  nucleic acid-binding Zn-ribbon protein